MVQNFDTGTDGGLTAEEEEERRRRLAELLAQQQAEEAARVQAEQEAVRAQMAAMEPAPLPPTPIGAGAGVGITDGNEVWYPPAPAESYAEPRRAPESPAFAPDFYEEEAPAEVPYEPMPFIDEPPPPTEVALTDGGENFFRPAPELPPEPEPLPPPPELDWIASIEPEPIVRAEEATLAALETVPIEPIRPPEDFAGVEVRSPIGRRVIEPSDGSDGRSLAGDGAFADLADLPPLEGYGNTVEQYLTPGTSGGVVPPEDSPSMQRVRAMEQVDELVRRSTDPIQPADIVGTAGTEVGLIDTSGALAGSYDSSLLPAVNEARSQMGPAIREELIKRIDEQFEASAAAAELQAARSVYLAASSTNEEREAAQATIQGAAYSKALAYLAEDPNVDVERLSRSIYNQTVNVTPKTVQMEDDHRAQFVIEGDVAYTAGDFTPEELRFYNYAERLGVSRIEFNPEKAGQRGIRETVVDMATLLASPLLGAELLIGAAADRVIRDAPGGQVLGKLMEAMAVPQKKTWEVLANHAPPFVTDYTDEYKAFREGLSTEARREVDQNVSLYLGMKGGAEQQAFMSAYHDAERQGFSQEESAKIAVASVNNMTLFALQAIADPLAALPLLGKYSPTNQLRNGVTAGAVRRATQPVKPADFVSALDQTSLLQKVAKGTDSPQHLLSPAKRALLENESAEVGAYVQNIFGQNLVDDPTAAARIAEAGRLGPSQTAPLAPRTGKDAIRLMLDNPALFVDKYGVGQGVPQPLHELVKTINDSPMHAQALRQDPVWNLTVETDPVKVAALKRAGQPVAASLQEYQARVEDAIMRRYEAAGREKLGLPAANQDRLALERLETGWKKFNAFAVLVTGAFPVVNAIGNLTATALNGNLRGLLRGAYDRGYEAKRGLSFTPDGGYSQFSGVSKFNMPARASAGVENWFRTNLERGFDQAYLRENWTRRANDIRAQAPSTLSTVDPGAIERIAQRMRRALNADDVRKAVDDELRGTSYSSYAIDPPIGLDIALETALRGAVDGATHKVDATRRATAALRDFERTMKPALNGLEHTDADARFFADHTGIMAKVEGDLGRGEAKAVASLVDRAMLSRNIELWRQGFLDPRNYHARQVDAISRGEARAIRKQFDGRVAEARGQYNAATTRTLDDYRSGSIDAHRANDELNAAWDHHNREVHAIADFAGSRLNRDPVDGVSYHPGIVPGTHKPLGGPLLQRIDAQHALAKASGTASPWRRISDNVEAIAQLAVSRRFADRVIEDADRHFTVRSTAGGTKLSAAQVRDLRAWGETMARQFNTVSQKSQAHGRTVANWTLNNYKDRGNWDVMLGALSPFALWTTRFAMKTPLMAAAGAPILADIHKLREAIERENDDAAYDAGLLKPGSAEAPPWLRSSVRIPLPGSIAGIITGGKGDLRLNMLNPVLPFDMVNDYDAYELDRPKTPGGRLTKVLDDLPVAIAAPISSALSMAGLRGEKAQREPFSSVPAVKEFQALSAIGAKLGIPVAPHVNVSMNDYTDARNWLRANSVADPDNWRTYTLAMATLERYGEAGKVVLGEPGGGWQPVEDSPEGRKALELALRAVEEAADTRTRRDIVGLLVGMSPRIESLEEQRLRGMDAEYQKAAAQGKDARNAWLAQHPEYQSLGQTIDRRRSGDAYEYLTRDDRLKADAQHEYYNTVQDIHRRYDQLTKSVPVMDREGMQNLSEQRWAEVEALQARIRSTYDVGEDFLGNVFQQPDAISAIAARIEQRDRAAYVDANGVFDAKKWVEDDKRLLDEVVPQMAALVATEGGVGMLDPNAAGMEPGAFRQAVKAKMDANATPQDWVYRAVKDFNRETYDRITAEYQNPDLTQSEARARAEQHKAAAGFTPDMLVERAVQLSGGTLTADDAARVIALGGIPTTLLESEHLNTEKERAAFRAAEDANGVSSKPFYAPNGMLVKTHANLAGLERAEMTDKRLAIARSYGIDVRKISSTDDRAEEAFWLGLGPMGAEFVRMKDALLQEYDQTRDWNRKGVDGRPLIERYRTVQAAESKAWDERNAARGTLNKPDPEAKITAGASGSGTGSTATSSRTSSGSTQREYRGPGSPAWEANARRFEAERQARMASSRTGSQRSGTSLAGTGLSYRNPYTGAPETRAERDARYTRMSGPPQVSVDNLQDQFISTRYLRAGMTDFDRAFRVGTAGYSDEAKWNDFLGRNPEIRDAITKLNEQIAPLRSDAEDPGDWDAIVAVQEEALRVGGLISAAVKADREAEEKNRDAEYQRKTDARRAESLKAEQERNARFDARDAARKEERAREEAARDAKYEVRGREIAASKQRQESGRIQQMQQIIDSLEARLAAARGGAGARAGGSGRQTARVAPVAQLTGDYYQLSPDDLEAVERKRREEAEKKKGRRR